MDAKRSITIHLILAALLSSLALPALADRRDHRDRDDNDRHYSTRFKHVNDRDARYYRDRGYVLDRRYDHNRYYPPPGTVIHTLPPRIRVVPYLGINYYFHDGVWYRPSAGRFTVTLPPVGITIPVLPPFYTTVWVSGIPYYYADGAYYHWLPERRVYVVTNPPTENNVNLSKPTQDQLFVYPKEGQNKEQQAEDRYQCHSWATENTGFDPTRALGNVEGSQYTSKRTDYNRAMKACLEARGYSVQ